MEYRVFWEIDVDTKNELEAAKEAFESMQEVGTTANFFTVKPMAHCQAAKEVDLSKPEGDQIEG